MKNLELDLAFTPFVFVYGTLKRGYCNNFILGESKFVSEGVSNLRGKLRHQGPPAFVPECWLPNGSEVLPVRGELWFLKKPEVLRQLDSLEGHPIGYYRSVTIVNTPTSEKVNAWCYFFNLDRFYEECPIIEGCFEWRPNYV